MYVNETGVNVASGATVFDVVRLLFPEQANAIAAGTMRVTDSRGLPMSAAAVVHGGAIFRVLPVRQQAGVAEPATDSVVSSDGAE